MIKISRYEEHIKVVIFKDKESMIDLAKKCYDAGKRVSHWDNSLQRILSDIDSNLSYNNGDISQMCIYLEKDRIAITHLRYYRKVIPVLYSIGDEVYSSPVDKFDKNKYFSLSKLTENTESPSVFAKKSHMYNKIMEDGNIFNPYIHRRFLPIQYLENIDNYDQFVNQLGFNYALAYTIKEIKTLELLSRIDKFTYVERRRFFTFGVIKEIIYAYCDRYINYDASRGLGNGALLEYGWVGTGNVKSVVNTIVKLRKDVAQANSYADILEAVNGFNFKKINNYNSQLDIPESWKSAFKSSGAFFTMKHLVMFEGYVFEEGMSTKDSLSIIKLTELNADVLHKMCIEMFSKGIMKAR